MRHLRSRQTRLHHLTPANYFTPVAMSCVEAHHPLIAEENPRNAVVWTNPGLLSLKRNARGPVRGRFALWPSHPIFLRTKLADDRCPGSNFIRPRSRSS